MSAEPFLTHARYIAGERLGQGAQGVVGRVIDREAKERALVAKVYRPGAFREQSLYGEFALLARLRVHGVVRAHDLGRDERTGAPFFVEEYVPGDDAAVWVRAAAPPERSARLAAVLADVARALAELHGSGFLHSDLKPAHVRMRPSPSPSPSRGVGADSRRGGAEAVLLDLGAAVSRARAPGGAAAFTAGFAAPEILAGGAPSPASDLYGLGAVAWAAAAGRPPEPSSARRRLRDQAPWVTPSIAEIIEGLVQIHPRDRPAEARDVLLRLGAATAEAGLGLGTPPAPIGRERELDLLLRALNARTPSGDGHVGIAGGSVRYITGPSGAGKSHLARELVTRALCAGHPARHLVFPREADPLLPDLIALLRGSSGAWPFATPPDEGRPLLVVLDDLELAPVELRAALDAFRCRPSRTRALSVIATARSAPDGAEAIELLPLSDQSFGDLCRALGVDGDDPIREAAAASGKSPGWLVASLGRVPLTRDTALERVRGCSPAAKEVLAAIAIAGGALSEEALGGPFARGSEPQELGELYEASLVTRREEQDGTVYGLAAKGLAKDLVLALATAAIADRVAAALLADARAPAASLLAAASVEPPLPAARRMDLLDKAAAQARLRGLRAEEIEARIALSADPARRTADHLCRLERLTRDAGVGAAYPQVLAWLDEAGQRDPRVRVLALRRRAEKSARDGDAASAQRLSGEALVAARELGDAGAEAFSLATMGLVALMRADWEEAEARLGEARALIEAFREEEDGERERDVEEVARLHHNAGVVAIYRGHIDDAIETFERSLAVKRGLGDRAGMRSCLMNLGIALGKAARYEEALGALDEAMKLARSLGQAAGWGWCLSALADIEVRRGRAREAERWVAEAEAIKGSVPAAIRADLVISRANVALLDGDGARAIEALAEVDEGVRASDPLVDARARIAEASAYITKLPAEPRRAARIAIAAARRARAASLGEAQAQALAVLRSARGRGGGIEPILDPPEGPPAAYPDGRMADSSGGEQALWAWMASVAEAEAPAEAGVGLARAIVAQSGAERALIAKVSSSGQILDAWGADLDGLPIAEAARRIPPSLVETALRQAAPVYLRDDPTPGGRGSRLAVAAGAAGAASGPPSRAVVVLEHRFRTACFDAVTAEQAARWATLAALFLRLFAGGARGAAPHSSDARPRSGEPGSGPYRLASPDETTLDAGEGRGRDAETVAARAVTTVVPSSEPRRTFPNILGQSSALNRALARLDAAIDSDSELPVLLTGETGTGKELFARALHELGARRSRELVPLNCGAVPDALFEAELFGHARGSFTGADRARPGLLARAEGGTLFLDELGELPLARQAALLRALETKRYRPVGSDEERSFDVRIIAATNRDLEQAVAAKTFRQDLLFRVNAITIPIPPLREREGDVPLLIGAFLERAEKPPSIAPDAMEALSAYDWPGNVRELEHVVQRLAALGVRRVELEHLPRSIRSSLRAPSGAQAGGRVRPLKPSPAPARATPDPAPPSAGRARGRPATEDDEREEIRRALDATGGNISRTAERLGLTRHGLKKRMVRLGMRPPSGALEKVS